MNISNSEIKIEGHWVFSNGQIIGDDATRRIEWLIKNVLIEVTQDASGWDILYLDPSDNRYWELTYPQSELHGGGPPTLTFIPEDQAREKYRLT